MAEGRLLIAFADEGAWRLYRRLGKECGDWSNFKLEGPNHRRKRSWWFGCNGERLQRNGDAAQLAQHEPGVYAWAEAECRKACKG
jgi:hypothetical protein